MHPFTIGTTIVRLPRSLIGDIYLQAFRVLELCINFCCTPYVKWSWVLCDFFEYFREKKQKNTPWQYMLCRIWWCEWIKYKLYCTRLRIKLMQKNKQNRLHSDRITFWTKKKPNKKSIHESKKRIDE